MYFLGKREMRIYRALCTELKMIFVQMVETCKKVMTNALNGCIILLRKGDKPLKHKTAERRKASIIMNKQECINFIIMKMKEQDEKRTKAKTWEEYNAADCYEECKKVCEENGYIDTCFEEMWTKANTTIARENGIYPNLPLYK